MKNARSQWWAVSGILLFLLILIVVGWSVRDKFLPVEVGTNAPNFTAHTLDGEEVSLADLNGEVLLLNIWATWCPPCRDEMPSMQNLHETLGPQGLRVVAVSIDAPPGVLDPGGRLGGDVERFAEELGLEFDIWLNPDGSVQEVYRTTGVPESFVIDRNGTIVKKVIGATLWDSDANIDLLRRLLEN